MKKGLEKVRPGCYRFNYFWVTSVIVGSRKEWRVEYKETFFGQFGSLALARAAIYRSYDGIHPTTKG
jgi:hypothetical protein